MSNNKKFPDNKDALLGSLFAGRHSPPVKSKIITRDPCRHLVGEDERSQFNQEKEVAKRAIANQLPAFGRTGETAALDYQMLLPPC